MSNRETKQRLGAILAADVAEYTRLMRLDEHVTVASLDAARLVFRRHIEDQKGRVIDMAGDSVLALFETASDAVTAAMAVQTELDAAPSEYEGDERMQFRIGVNLGEVLEKADGTVYGDGVNIAARLEGLAEPGTVAVSDIVRQTVENRLDFALADMGEHEVKNVANPVHAFRVLKAGEKAPPAPRKARSPKRALPLVASLIVVLAIAGIATWMWPGTDQQATETGASSATVTIAQGPTIAVLPFANMTGDPEQEYFADGIVEDIITRMTQIREIGVIARNSSFQFKDQSIDVREVGDELNADYVLEGSVRRAGETLRIAVQLIGTDDGVQLWADTFERQLSAVNIFEIQDEITTKVATVVGDLYGFVLRDVHQAINSKPVVQLNAYECVLRAYYWIRDPGPESYNVARECLKKATENEPDYADAWAIRSAVSTSGALIFGYPYQESLENSVSFANRALQIDPNHQYGYFSLVYAYFATRNFAEMFKAADRAVELNPNNSALVGEVAAFVTVAGEWEKGKALLDEAVVLNPNYPPWLNYAFTAYFYKKQDFEASLKYGMDYVARAPNIHLAYWPVICSLGMLDRPDAAAPHIKRMLALYSDFDGTIHDELSYWYIDQDLIDLSYECFRRAGLDIVKPAG